MHPYAFIVSGHWRFRALVVLVATVSGSCGGKQGAPSEPPPTAVAATPPQPPTVEQRVLPPKAVAPSGTQPAPSEAVALESDFRLPVVPQEQTRVRVLMYHSLGWHPPRPGVNPRKLRDQLTWMRNNLVEVIRLSQLLDFLDGDLQLPERVAVITIDDGELNNFTVAYPIFVEHEVPFALGIATEAIERWQSRGTMQWHQIKEMVDSGWCEIASHSHTHRNLRALSTAQLRRELELSRELIEQHTGFQPSAFFYPLGAHSEPVRRLTREAGYRAGFIAWGAPVHAQSGRFRLNRYAVEKGTGLYTFARYFSHGD